MTERWHRTADLVGLPGMPKSARSIQLHGARKGWVHRTVAWGNRANVLEWLESSLPAETQTALRAARGEDTPQESPDTPPPDLTALIPDTGSADLMDARAHVVMTFEAWHAATGGPLVAALRAFVSAWAAGEIAAPAETFELIPSLHWSTLQRWRSLWHKSGVRALQARSGGRKPLIERDPDVADLVASMIFQRPDHVTARHIHRALRTRHPDARIPTIRAIRRYMARFKIDYALDLDAVTDRDGHRSRNRPAFGDASADITALNQLWELDSTPADLLCTDGKRYAIVGAIDVWSRRGKLLLAPVSCSAAIAALLRRCLLDWGVPEEIRTDEGADYTSKHIRRVIGDLGVTHDILPPYSPDQKPFVERFLGTVSRDLLSQLPGFTGHNVAEREKLRGRKSFADRRGKKEPALFEVALSPEQLQARLDTWCEALYGREAHSGLGGQSPFLQAASWSHPVRTVDERSLDILLAPPAGDGTRVIQKRGIMVDGGCYIAAEFGLHMSARVQVRQDPGDWGRIYVFDAEGRFICVAEDPVRTGIDRAEVAARAKALAAQADKAARKWARDLKRAHRPGSIMDEVLDAAAAAAGTVTPFPAPATPHDSPGLRAAEAANGPSAQRSSRERNRKFVEYYRKKGKI